MAVRGELFRSAAPGSASRKLHAAAALRMYRQRQFVRGEGDASLDDVVLHFEIRYLFVDGWTPDGARPFWRSVNGSLSCLRANRFSEPRLEGRPPPCESCNAATTRDQP